MTPEVRLGYLEALGIRLWVRREKLAEFTPAPAATQAPTPARESSPAAAATGPSASATSVAKAPPVPETGPASAVAPASPRVERKPRALRLGPGEGPGLFLCAGPGEASGPLAGDLGRTLGGQPAWAWPDAGSAARPVETVSEERMFTAIVVFGAGLARAVFGGQPPVTCGAARVLIAPSMAELKSSAKARQACWKVLRESGVISAP